MDPCQVRATLVMEGASRTKALQRPFEASKWICRSRSTCGPGLPHKCYLGREPRQAHSLLLSKLQLILTCLC